MRVIPTSWIIHSSTEPAVVIKFIHVFIEYGARLNASNYHRGCRKSLIAKFLIYCLLIVCYLPLCVMLTVQKLRGYGSANFQSVHKMSFVLVFRVNSTLNPFIYCWRFHNIRSAVIETARKISCLDEHSDQFGGQISRHKNWQWHLTYFSFIRLLCQNFDGQNKKSRKTHRWVVREGEPCHHPVVLWFCCSVSSSFINSP